MRAIYLAIPLSAAFALAACGGNSDETSAPKTTDEVIAEAGKLVKPQPGKYTTQAKMIDFSVPGLPKEQAERMKAMMGDVASKNSSYCLTKEEAEKGFEESVRKLGEGEGGQKCTFDKFEADGGKLDAVLSCTGQGGVKGTMKMKGTVTPTSNTMHMDMTQESAAIPGGSMHMEMEMTSTRTGECS